MSFREQGRGGEARILVAFIIALPLAMPDSGGAQTPRQEAAQLRIASDATFPPFHYIGDGGIATGFEIELARITAERTGFQPVVMVLPYDDLLSGLTTGAHDVVAATTGVTPERERAYLFTKPHFETCQAALVRSGTGEPRSVTELKGRRVGAAGAGTAARAMRMVAGARQVQLGKGEQGVPSLERGVIDALIMDEFSAVRVARASDGRLRVLREPVALERYAFVLPKTREDLKRRLDEVLSDLERQGRIDQLRDQFGVKRDSEWPVEMGR